MSCIIFVHREDVYIKIHVQTLKILFKKNVKLRRFRKIPSREFMAESKNTLKTIDAKNSKRLSTVSET